MASTCTQIISERTLSRCDIYFWLLVRVIDCQKRGMLLTSVVGFHLPANEFLEKVCTASTNMYVQVSITFTFNSCHRFSIGLASGLSGGVFHQLIDFSAKSARARRDVCDN